MHNEKYSDLVSSAIAKGASKAKVFTIYQSIVLDPRVRLKCRVPLCSSYGRNLMCPPNTFTLEEMDKILSNFETALFLQIISDSGTGFAGAKKMHELINILEKESQKLGFNFATGFIAGECKLCEECVGQNSSEPCRHPFKARPSLEGVGIDVLQTAKNIGLPFDLLDSEHITWNGLLLLE